jgi:hypothetical protein
MTLDELRKSNRPFALEKRFHAHRERYSDAGKISRAFLAADCEVRAHNAQPCDVTAFSEFD